MGFFDYVKGLRRSNAPLPFSSKLSDNMRHTLEQSKEEYYSTIATETKLLKPDEIDFIL